MNTLLENTLSENTLLENTLSENTLSENTLSENTLFAFHFSPFTFHFSLRATKDWKSESVTSLRTYGQTDGHG